jgi:hypothetical protein
MPATLLGRGKYDIKLDAQDFVASELIGGPPMPPHAVSLD